MKKDKLKAEILIGIFLSVFFLISISLNYRTAESRNEYDICVESSALQDASIISPEEEYNIFIDLTESMLYLFKSDELIRKYPIAQGTPETPSPIGVFRITRKARDWGSGFGSRWLSLNVPWGMYGIHGTNDPGSIGYRSSKGCFRMRNRDVEELYTIIGVGTMVVVWGGPFGNLGGRLEKLAPGSRRSEVSEVQKRLKNLGYYQGKIDGIYGENMKQALLDFKRDLGLPITHYVDSKTYQALGIMLFE